MLSWATWRQSKIIINRQKQIGEVVKWCMWAHFSSRHLGFSPPLPATNSRRRIEFDRFGLTTLTCIVAFHFAGEKTLSIEIYNLEYPTNVNVLSNWVLWIKCSSDPRLVSHEFNEGYYYFFIPDSQAMIYIYYYSPRNEWQNKRAICIQACSHLFPWR